MLYVLALVVLALALWSLVQAGRLRADRAVLWTAAAMLAVGVWLIGACGAESFDVGYGFVANDGPLPTLFVATRLQLVGAGLVWGATMLVAAVVGVRLTRRSARSAD